ncbi:MarR family winged helix-turn-helix transcriptional regulator [uncultured Amnibacterium sp.]|uniref:MarR family winged helix-turn-helix transcriptional regulator n=1 Tax=uncultured Amnibacterium sp. TaxID=1631851 RepID=UPI0035CB7339
MSQHGEVQLAGSVGYLLKEAAYGLRVALDAVLRPLDLSVTEYSCLELLAQRPGLSNSELARSAFVTRQSMNVVLQAMERDGLIVRPAQAPAGRALPAQLTALGQQRRAQASTAARAVEDRMLTGFGPGEIDRLRELLQVCAASVNDERRDPVSAGRP